jgi:hypothetical protein
MDPRAQHEPGDAPQAEFNALVSDFGLAKNIAAARKHCRNSCEPEIVSSSPFAEVACALPASRFAQTV